MSELAGLLAAAAAAFGLARCLDAPRLLRNALGALGTIGLFSAAGATWWLFGIPQAASTAALLAVALAAFRFGRTAPLATSGAYRALFFFAALLAGACVIEACWRFPDGGADAFIIWNV